jgi:hypothetical protein
MMLWCATYTPLSCPPERAGSRGHSMCPVQVSAGDVKDVQRGGGARAGARGGRVPASTRQVADEEVLLLLLAQSRRDQSQTRSRHHSRGYMMVKILRPVFGVLIVAARRAGDIDRTRPVRPPRTHCTEKADVVSASKQASRAACPALPDRRR